MPLRGSPLALLPIGALSAAGFFRTKGAKSFALTNIWGEGIFNHSSYSLTMHVTTFTGSLEVELTITKKPIKYGYRPYFICPICKQVAADLVFLDNIVCCINDYYKLFSEFSKGHRQSLIREARDVLRATRQRDMRLDGGRPKRSNADCSPYGERLLAASSAHLKERRATTRRDLTTEHALNLGRGANQHDIYFEYLRYPGDHWRKEGAPRPHTPPTSPASMFETPVLDIRVLTDKFPFVAGMVKAQSFGWDMAILNPYSPLLFADARGDPPFFIVASHSYAHDDLRWQHLAVRTRGNGRVHFVCPATGESCDRLYWREGMFASWRAQKLYHPSQRGKARKR